MQGDVGEPRTPAASLSIASSRRRSASACVLPHLAALAGGVVPRRSSTRWPCRKYTLPPPLARLPRTVVTPSAPVERFAIGRRGMGEIVALGREQPRATARATLHEHRRTPTNRPEQTPGQRTLGDSQRTAKPLEAEREGFRPEPSTAAQPQVDRYVVGQPGVTAGVTQRPSALTLTATRRTSS